MAITFESLLALLAELKLSAAAFGLVLGLMCKHRVEQLPYKLRVSQAA